MVDAFFAMNACTGDWFVGERLHLVEMIYR